MKARPGSIKVSLTLWYLLLTAVVLAFFSGLTYYMLARSLYLTVPVESDLHSFTVQSSPMGTPSNVGPPGLWTATDNYLPIFSYSISREALDKKRSQLQSLLVLTTSQGLLPVDEKQYITDTMSGVQEVWLYYRQSATPGTFDMLAITQSKSSVAQIMQQMKMSLVLAIPVTMLLVGSLGFFLVKRMLRPVAAITTTAREIRENDLSQRIPVTRNDELGRLSRTLNETFEDLHNTFERERQFTSDASHELRTPLAIIQGEASLALNKQRSVDEYRKSLEAISAKVSDMSLMVEKLLTLARVGSAKEDVILTDVDLSEVLSDIATDAELLCDEKGIHLQTEAPDEAVIKGDRTRLHELLLNLLDNAIKFTPEGGTIGISLKRDTSMACITVRDNGIGIPEEHLPHIFERFYRVDKSLLQTQGKGSGLGLAICRQIAELHGGRIDVMSEVGVGTTFSVLLPLAGSSPEANSS